MSDVERTPAPRRSVREKKRAQKFTLSTPSKRRRTEEIDDEADASDAEVHGYDEEDDDGDDYAAPRKLRGGTRGRGRGRGKAGGPSIPRKHRTVKVSESGKTPTRRQRKPADKRTNNQAPYSEAKIADDNTLFNSILNPVAALQSTIEDFLESFQQAQNPALADIINCVLRSCGSNDSVDADRVVDYDGIVDALDDFTEVLKENEAPTYPLTSKHPQFKKFRKSLSEFLARLVQSAAELKVLYTSDLLMTIQAWVIAMSSSQLRSFRHTATVIALEIETALCEVAALVEKEAELVTRQKDTERKRTSKSKGTASNREKELNAKALEVKERRSKLAEFLKEFFDGVFIHRYRDLDPNIRAECVHSMGNWLKKFPAHFLDGQYLRYIGWVLSDANTHVRLEAVKSLIPLYMKEDFIVSLTSFTDRFKPRLVEMATGDTEVAVRVAAVQVLSAIDTQGLLEENQRSVLCLLVFDTDIKVRRAVSNFVRGVLEDETEQRLVGKRQPTENERKRANLKALAKHLVEWSRKLDQENAVGEDTTDGELSSQDELPSGNTSMRSIGTIPAEQKGRIALAVESLWNDVEAIGDWESMLELLLLDHSAGTDTSQGSSRRKKAKKVVDDLLVDEAWRLDESEEAILLEVLVASLRKVKSETSSLKKGEEDNVSSELTRELIKSLPNLITKHQTDENRISNVLLIPEIMDIDLYLEMRMTTAYESLWDDVTKQFLTHSSSGVLTNAISTIRHFMGATSLANINSTKILELEDELASSLRDTIGGRDELEVTTFKDDEALALGAICARLCALSGIRDLTAWMEEDEGGKQSSAWDIICALAERGRLGYKEEELMVDRALQLLTLHLIWKARQLMLSMEIDEKLQEPLREQRQALLEKLEEFAIGDRSNTLLSVKRSAFQNLLTLYTLFANNSGAVETSNEEDSLPASPLASLSLSMNDEIQYRCAGFIQAEIERYAEELEAELPSRPREPTDDENETGNETTGEVAVEKEKKGRKGKGKSDTGTSIPMDVIRSKSHLEREYIFTSTIAAFLRVLRAGIIQPQHGVVLLTHYGRLGPAFDLSTKLMVDILREEGMVRENGQLVVDVIIRALRESFTLYLDRIIETTEHTLSLAKALSSCLIVRGAQLSVLRKLPSEYVIAIQTTLVSWAIKKFSVYDNMKNKRGRLASLIFFKALQHLLVGIEPGDALKIKAHLEQDIAKLGIEVPVSAKMWDPYRSYEKRLTNATTKTLKERAGRMIQAKGTEILTEDETDEDRVEDMILEDEPGYINNDKNGLELGRKGPQKRSTSQSQDETQNQSLVSESGVNENTDGGNETRSELTQLSDYEHMEAPSPDKDLSTNGAVIPPSLSPPASHIYQSTPKPKQGSKKRGRESEAETPDDEVLAEDSRDESVPQAMEIVIRRKRVRH